MIILHEIAAASAVTPSVADKKTLFLNVVDGRPWLKDSTGVSTPLDGNTILYGTAAPTTEGVDGNFYIRTTTSFIYGPKVGGVWPAGASLVGANGKSLLTGAVDPTTEGADGDSYFNTASKTYFGPKAAGVWPAGIPLTPNPTGTGFWRSTASVLDATVSKFTATEPATAATLTIADNKTLTVNNSLTFNGTDGTTHILPTTSSTLARTDAAQSFTGLQTFAAGINIGSSATNTVATSGGKLVLSPWTGELWFGSGGSTGMRTANQFAFSDIGSISWTNTSNNFYGATQDLFLTRKSTANIRQGNADAAAPVAQTSSVQSVVAGTSNTAGAARTYEGSQSTGSADGGPHVFKISPAGAPGTAQNALATAFTINGDGSTTHSMVAVLKNYTVGTLPTASSYTYGRAFVSDALTPTFGSTVVAGGAVVVPVYSDGSNWIVG